MRFLLFIYTLLMTVVVFLALTKQAKASETLEIEELIRIEAFRQNVNADLAVAIATVESSLKPNAKGSLDEQGLFQLHPKWHAANPLIYQPHGNIVAGISYLSRVVALCTPKYGDAAFVCFNAGPYQRLPYKNPKRTDYYKKVTAEIKRIEQSRKAGGN